LSHLVRTSLHGTSERAPTLSFPVRDCLPKPLSGWAVWAIHSDYEMVTTRSQRNGEQSSDRVTALPIPAEVHARPRAPGAKPKIGANLGARTSAHGLTFELWAVARNGRPQAPKAKTDDQGRTGRAGRRRQSVEPLLSDPARDQCRLRLRDRHRT